MLPNWIFLFFLGGPGCNLLKPISRPCYFQPQAKSNTLPALDIEFTSYVLEKIAVLVAQGGVGIIEPNPLQTNKCSDVDIYYSKMLVFMD